MKMKTAEERNMGLAKAMEMSKLFQEPYYSMIEEILEVNQKDKKAAAEKFKQFAAEQNKMIKANMPDLPEFLTAKQQAWLWNYLSHYDKKTDWMPAVDW